jgi:hypothetical protein
VDKKETKKDIRCYFDRHLFYTLIIFDHLPLSSNIGSNLQRGKRMTQDVSEQKLKDLEKEFENFDADRQRAPTENKASKDTFCKLWPDVKLVLEFLRSLPVVPESVKKAVGVVVAAGDTVHKIIC